MIQPRGFWLMRYVLLGMVVSDLSLGTWSSDEIE